MAREDADSLLRAVAAAPALRPPQHAVSALIANHVDGLDRAATVLCEDVTVVAGAVRATVRDHDDAMSVALTLRASFPAVRFAVVVANAADAQLVDRALTLFAADSGPILLDLATGSGLDARYELRAIAGGWAFVTDRAAPGTSNSTPDRDVAPAFALTHWGMRFAELETERSYRDWYRDAVVPYLRIGSLVVLIGWMMIAAALAIAHPPSFAAAIACVLVSSVIGGCHLASTYVMRWRSWIIASSVMLFAVVGAIGVLLGAWVVDLPAAGAAAAVNVAFLAFAVFRLPFAKALVAAMPGGVVAEMLLFRAYDSGQLGWTAFIVFTLLPALAFAMAACAGVFSERLSRASYRLERIVEIQQGAISRGRQNVSRLEREAADREKKLLEAEIRRQVAERARDLSEAIMRLGDGLTTGRQLAPGDEIEGRYQVIRGIGEGGMGQVFEVARLDDGRRLALKVLTRVADRSSLARFAREAQLAAELDHPNVVAVIDLGVTATGVLYLVMPLVTGSSLDRARARFGDAGWALPILLQVADAVVAMHERGIIHRDLKPANVLLDGDRVKVTDFGIASLSAQAANDATPDGATALAATPLTRTGMLVGTPSYMAPELCGGGRHAGPASDAFSLGVVAYELLSGRLPHASPPVLDGLAGRTAVQVVALGALRTELPPELTELVDRCLCAVPSERPTVRVIADGFRTRVPRELTS